MTAIGIVGAGGAAAALTYVVDGALPEAEITVLEKSGGVCGRAATRRNGAITYDYGTNYVKDRDQRVADLLTETLDTDGRVEIDEPIYTFDRTGAVSEGRESTTSKWSYEDGLTQIAKRLFARTDATVHRRTRVETLRRADDYWRLLDDDGTSWGPFDAIVVTPPAPQTATLLADAEWDWEGPTEELIDAVRSVSYQTIWTAVLHYPFAIERPYYALINTDDEHAIGWIAREECKPGHVPADESLLVVQAAPDWSEQHYDDPPAENIATLAELTADIMNDERLADPDWTDHQGWRYALPEAGAPTGVLQSAESAGLYCAGDWVAGEARLHAAMRNGLDVGERLVYAL